MTKLEFPVNYLKTIRPEVPYLLISAPLLFILSIVVVYMPVAAYQTHAPIGFFVEECSELLPATLLPPLIFPIVFALSFGIRSPLRFITVMCHGLISLFLLVHAGIKLLYVPPTWDADISPLIGLTLSLSYMFQFASFFLIGFLSIGLLLIASLIIIGGFLSWDELSKKGYKFNLRQTGYIRFNLGMGIMRRLPKRDELMVIPDIQEIDMMTLIKLGYLLRASRASFKEGESPS